MTLGSRRQWLAAASLGLMAMGVPPSRGLAGVPVVAVTFECGAGYHKPPHGQCVPDAGRPLLRFNRYPVGDRGIAPASRGPGLGRQLTMARPAAPWR